MDGQPEAPTHIPIGWPPVDSDDDNDSDDDDRKERKGSSHNGSGSMVTGVNSNDGKDGKELKRIPGNGANGGGKGSVNASNDNHEEKQRLLGLTGPNRPITKEVGVGASPRSSSRGLAGMTSPHYWRHLLGKPLLCLSSLVHVMYVLCVGGGGSAPAKRTASSRAGKLTGINNPNLPDDLTISSSPPVVSPPAPHPVHVTGAAPAATSQQQQQPAIPRGPRSGHDGSPLLTPRSIGRKVGGKSGADKSSSPRRQLGLGSSGGTASISSSTTAAAKPKSRFETVVQRPASDDDDEEEDGEGEDQDDDDMDEGSDDGKIEQKMSPRTAFNHNMKKRPRQTPKLPTVASPAHFASSRVLLQLASAPASPSTDFHELLPAEARAIIGQAPVSPSTQSILASTIHAHHAHHAGITGLPNAAIPVTVPGSPGSSGTPKPAFLRRLDSPQSHHGKLLAMKSKSVILALSFLFVFALVYNCIYLLMACYDIMMVKVN
jgi:hypothetical protein